MSTIHLPSGYPARLAEILADVSDRLSLGLTVQVVPGGTGRGLVEVSNDDARGRTQTRYMDDSDGQRP